VSAVRWTGDAFGDAPGELERAVAAFARREGMAEPLERDLAAAVAEAVCYALDDGGRQADGVVVDARADGTRVSVRVEGGSCHCGAGADAVLDLPLVMALADRFRITSADGTGMTVTMEFGLKRD